MNNYPEFKNYNYTNMYNKTNASYNNLYNETCDNMSPDMNAMYIKASKNNMQKDDNINNLYDPYNGFIRGNLFKNLYDPYKLKEPYEIKPMNEQAELLTYIDALGFSMTDLNLYLDIYPNDKNAINLFNQYRKEKESLLNQYESKFGPITLNSDSLNSFPWSWDDMPWPWDN